jgi:hypothetical protein
MTNIYEDCLTTATSGDAFILYELIEPYLTHKSTEFFHERSTKVSKLFGFPSDHVLDFLRSRRTYADGLGRSAKYISDSGEIITVGGKYKQAFRQVIGPRFLYESYDAGKYADMLDDLKRISELEYSKLVTLLNLRHVYSPVVSVDYQGEEKTYDLSMANPRSPSFIANGCLVHNSGNSFGLVCAHKIENDIIVDIVAEVMPLPGVPLNHTRIFEELIHPIISRQNVVYVCADRWNSIKLLSDIEAEYGILTKQYSLKYRDFFNFRVMMEQQQVHWPKPSMPLADIVNTGPGDYPAKFLTRPSDHLALQCLTVQDTGTKVVKGDGDLNDDIWRALVLAATLISLPELEQVFSRKRLDEQKDRMLGTMRSGQRDRVGQANATSQRYGTMGKALGVAAGRRDPS